MAVQVMRYTYVLRQAVSAASKTGPEREQQIRMQLGCFYTHFFSRHTQQKWDGLSDPLLVTSFNFLLVQSGAAEHVKD